MGNKTNRYLAIAAIVLALVWWFYPRTKEEPPALPVEQATEHAEKPEPAPPKEEAAKVPEAPPPAPSEDEEDLVPPAITPDEIKTLRQQAKGVLSSFYASQRAFHMEFNRYTTDLKAVGWSPNSGNMNYKLGFLSETKAQPTTETDRSFEDTRRMSTDDFDGEDYTNIERFIYSREVAGLTLQEFARYCRKGCTSDQETFEIMLVLPLGDNRHVDVWLINEKKELVHVRDGTTGREPEPPP